MISKVQNSKTIILLPSSPKLLKTAHIIENPKENTSQKAIVKLFSRYSPMYGGLVKESAALHEKWWQPKDNKGSGYYIDQAIARNGISTPTIAVFFEDGKLGASIYPIRINGSTLAEFPTNWNQLTGDGMWTTDVPNGRIITCPQVSADMRGSSQIIIGEAVLPLSAYYFASNELDLITAYTRPSYFGSMKGMPIEEYVRMVEAGNGPKLEFALNMHRKLGAQFVRIDANGCFDPAAGNYNLIADYTPFVVANLISLLIKIEGVSIIENARFVEPKAPYILENQAYTPCKQIGDTYIYKMRQQAKSQPDTLLVDSPNAQTFVFSN